MSGICSIYKRLWPYLFLFLLALLAFMQVSFLQHPLKYDLLDQAFPWKYFIGESLQHHLLPLWNPYQLLGSPIHADPQSSAWYPVVWLVGYIFGYNIYSVSLDFVFHIFLAGAGMYFLVRSLKIRKDVAFLAATSYMLSGFFVGNAQHFMWIISGSWMPFLIGIYLRMSDTGQIRYVFLLALVSFMFMTGGYPAFILISGYFLLVLFLFYLIRDLVNRNFREALRFIGLNVFSAVLIVIVNAVVLISWMQLSQEITRGDGVTLTQALFGPFSPECFVSFLFPLGTTSSTWIFGTDMSMANGFFGLVMLTGALAAIFVRNGIKTWIFIFWGLLMLGISMGNALPLREFLYHHVPFMDLFRFPALFRLFAIMGLIIGAASFFNRMLEYENRHLLLLKIFSAFLFAGILLTTIILFFNTELYWREYISIDLFTMAKGYTSAQLVLFHGLFQTIFSGLIVLVVFLVRSKERLFRILMIIAVTDLVLAAQLNGPYTVYAGEAKSSEIHASLKKMPDGFPLPSHKPVIRNTDRGKSITPLWRNLHLFYKKIAWDGYNPLHLNGFEYYADSLPNVFRASLNRSPVFLSYRGISMDSVLYYEAKDSIPGDAIFLENNHLVGKSTAKNKQHEGDTVIYTGFTPQRFDVLVKTSFPAYVTYQNNNYPGWKVEADGESATVITANNALITTWVGPGTHEVSFIYRPLAVIRAFYVTILSLALIFAGWLFCLIRGQRGSSG